MKQLAMACVVTASVVAMAGGVAAQTQAAAAVTVAPVAIKEVRPAYPKAALKEKRQGSVWLTVRVEPDGTVGAVRVTQSLSPRLDAEAVKAAKQWRFTPGTKNGKAVPVETQLEMTFTLR